MADLLAPATGKKIAAIKNMETAELVGIKAKAEAVQKSWAAMPAAARKKRLIKIREYVLENSDKISGIVAECTGKTPNDAFAGEVFPAVISVGNYLRSVNKVLKRKKLKRSSLMFFNKTSYLFHEPYGVIGIISPWNYPFGIPFHEVLVALAAGNSVLLKLATQAQPLGDIFEEMASFADLPQGLLNIINIKGSLAGKAFLNAGINKLFFTGSVDVGKELMALAADKLIPVSLELGGNDAMIVCSDANIYRAAAGAVWGGISNCGQSCGGVERIYVMENVYDEFVETLAAMINGLRQGLGYEVDFGSLTTLSQKKKVEEHIKDALAKGARIRAKSPEVTGDFFHQAVLLENVTHDMDVMKHETFGPVLGVCKVKDEDEAIKLANDSYLGLTGSIWTRNRKRGMKLAARMEAGAITLNDHLMSHGMSETPWGGYKMSSLGRSHGGAGLLEAVQSKVVVYDSTHFLPRNIWWHPYSEKGYNGLKSAMNAFFNKSVFKRFISTFKLISFYVKRMKK